MSVALLNQGPSPLEASGRLKTTPAGLGGVAMRWIVERLAEVEHGDPPMDLVLPGGTPRQGYDAYAGLAELRYEPEERNPNDRTADRAMVTFEVGIVAGSQAVEDDPFLPMDLGDRVQRLLDEYERSEVTAIGRGEQRDVTLYLDRATIDERVVEVDELAVRTVVVRVARGVLATE